MKISKIIAAHGEVSLACGGGRCPAFYLTEEGMVVIQGALVAPNDRANIDIPSDEDVVAMPLDVLKKLINHLENA